MTDYLVYDVFTDAPFGGNPLAVIPDARGLPEDRLQKIAREFNFSETTFVLPPQRPGCDAKVRIFTPMQELRFAGHPIVGTAVALHDLGRFGPDMTLEIGVGPVPVRVGAGFARFVTHVPLQSEAGMSTSAAAACVGLDESHIRTDRHQPVRASLGTEFVLVELTDEDALRRCLPVINRFRDAARAEDGWLALLVYVRQGTEIRARMFHPLGGVPEDPATGSAAAALAAYLGQLEGASMSLSIRQGIEMGRPSLIAAEVSVDQGVPIAVAIGGRAVRVMEGRLTV